MVIYLKRRLLKYFVIFFLFFIGVSLGNVKTKDDEVMYPIEQVENNFFMRLGNTGEIIINKGFSVVFNTTGSVLKTIFGL